jgi:hypothetical protein
MFAVVLAMIPVSGCSQRHILRMSNPEMSSTVTLFEQGAEDTADDDLTIVLDEPRRIAKVAAFFQARAEKWTPLAKEFRRKPRATITFRRNEQETDRFWLERDRLCLRQPNGEYYTCQLSDAERAELMSIFRFTTNFKSDG